jgi:outer membrane protein OmpA-like peptidoglycan-associated protein
MKQIILFSLCVFTFSLFAQTSKIYEIKNLEINTEFSDFGTSYYGENGIIYSSSKKGFGNTSRNWGENNQPFLDLYVGKIESNNEISNSLIFSGKVNSNRHDAMVAFSSDKKTLYFTRNNYQNNKKLISNDRFVNLGIYSSKMLENDEWSEPIALPFNNKDYSCGHPTLSLDGKYLYFSSDMPGGFGATDIYYIEINKDGSFGSPINLGPKINTKGKEAYPFISSNNTLYFSSDKGDENPQLDIYSISLNDLKTTSPIKLEAPINSPFDDFAFVIHSDFMKGYFSSNREGGKGDDDIYSFYVEPPKVVCNQKVQGKIIDSADKKNISDATITLSDEKGKTIQSIIVKVDASYTFDIECNKKYQLKASKIGYTDKELEFESTNENLKSHNIVMNLLKEEFEAVEEKIVIKINPIYFNLNSSQIRPDAERELIKVVEVMNRYPDMIIECGSHTDSRSNDKYNMWLSKKRATNTIEYILSKGISKDRISGNGYGESQILNKCTNGVQCSEAQHQLNRRTEFVVIRKE